MKAETEKTLKVHRPLSQYSSELERPGLKQGERGQKPRLPWDLYMKVIALVKGHTYTLWNNLCVHCDDEEDVSLPRPLLID